MNYIKSIVSLRGIASLFVCIYHLVLGNPILFDDGSLIKQVGKFGYLGVEIFFIISGFVVPYAMYKNNYQLARLGNFLTRRAIRVEIPYIASLLLVIVLNYLSSLFSVFNGTQFSLSFSDVLINLFYLSDVFHVSWFQPLYYTLKIEFQFYFLIGLIFAFVVSKNNSVRVLTFIFLLALSFFSGIELFRYITLFLLGMSTFLYKVNKLELKYFILSSLLLLGVMYFQFYSEIVVISAFSILYILYVTVENRYLDFFGKISFSLYLVHIPIGGKLINLGLRYVNSSYQNYILVLLALIVSISFAYLFYRIIELPALNASRKIKYIINTK